MRIKHLRLVLFALDAIFCKYLIIRVRRITHLIAIRNRTRMIQNNHAQKASSS